MLPDGFSFFASGREPVRPPPLTSATFVYASERQSVRAPLVTRVVALTLAFLAAVSVALAPIPSLAAEIPGVSVFSLQTSGPNVNPNTGSWYTSATAGAGHDYVVFTVPCGWPAATPVYVDLFSPEMNAVTGPSALSEEPAGAYDSTQYELYGPGATVGPGFASPAPGAGIGGTRVTYQPGGAGVAEAWNRYATLAAPVACGSYVVRAQVLAADPLNPGGTGDDQNGWRIRVGTDNDGIPTNAPPANYDNPDGVLGTNDEIVLGGVQVQFQHDAAGLQCQTFYEYTTPGQASVTFSNFDMDAGTSRVRYYAAGDASYVATGLSGGTLGTVSADGVWNNGGTLATRVGDTIANPTTGWWRIVSCATTHNGFVQEGQLGRTIFYTQPLTPRMILTKTDGVANASPGQALTYTITATNNAPAATGGAANNVVVTDTIPAGFTYTGCSIPTPAQGTWTCSQAAGVVTFTQTGWINRGAVASLRVTGTVNQGVSGTITDTARVNYTDEMGNPFAQVTATDVDNIVPSSNLSITKTASSNTVNPGQSFTFTLTVNNLGPANATNVVVSDTVPSQYTVTNVTSPTGSCGNVGNVVTCNRASFLFGAAAWVITVNVTVKTTTPGGTYVNTATVSATENDPTPANNTVNRNNTVRSYGDLTLTKTDGTTTVTPGTSTTYTITITNNGPSTEPAGVRFTDTIPAGTVGSEAEADCAIAANVFTCTTVATIAAGSSRSYQLTLAVPSGYAPATLVNTANITVRPITDPDLTNNSATDSDTVTRSADLSIVKTDSTDPVTPGQAFIYTLTVTNNGPSNASTLSVSDTVPAQFTVTSVTSPGATCGFSGNVVTCTRPTLIAAAAWVITVSVTANVAAPPGTYTNTATVSAATADPTPANNSSSQNTTISPSADLAVTKTDGVASVVAGTSTTYTITLTNNSLNAVAAGVVVSDPIPAGTVGSESEPDCVIAAGTFTCTTAAVLNSGASAVYQLTLAVAPGYLPATLANTASITSSPATDPNAANNTATDTDTVTKTADLSITKADGVGSVIAGTSTTYTITVTNNGPSDVPAGVVVSDTIPAGTAGSETDPNCAVAAGTFTCTTPAAIASGSSVTYQLTLAVAASYAAANLSNSASITSAPATDPNGANNTATDTDNVTTSADLSIAKTDSVDPVIPGQAFTYTITVTNNGPSDSATLTVSDTVPAQFTVTNVTSPAGSCNNAGNVVTCTRATFAPGSWVITVFVTADLGAAAGTYTNTATVSAAAPDPVPGNDSASQDTTIIPSADLSIVKTDSVDPLDPGLPFDYTIVVTNNGPSDAVNVEVTDTIPTSGDFSITGIVASAGLCGNVGQVVTCTLGSLSSGGTWTITISILSDPLMPGGLYTNTAVVTSDTADPVPGNDSDSEGTIVLPAADLAVTKTDGAGSVTAGNSTTYTITLTNNGPSGVGAGVVVSDPIPVGTTGIESEADCSIAAGTFTCTTAAPLLPAASVSYQLTLDLPPDYPSVSLSNTATITFSPVAETDPSNDSATDTDAVEFRGELAITKTDGVATITAGTSTTYTITATNTGPSQIPAGVVISDPIPTGTAGNESEPDCSIASSVFTCTTTAPMAVGAVVSYALTLAVSPGYLPATLANTASITSSPATDTNPVDDSATDTDTVTKSADLALTKDDGVASLIAGTSTNYTITVTNNGPSTEPAGVVLSDPIPAGMVASESEPDCAIAAGTFTCTTSAAIPPSASLSYVLTLAVPPDSAIVSLTNTVSITSAPVPDPDPANDAASDTDTVTTSADLALTKNDGVASVIAGTSTTYAITVTNDGPSTEPAGVVINDPIPAGTNPTETEPECVIAASVFTCTTTAPLAPGAFKSYQLTLAISADSVLVSLANTATIAPPPVSDPAAGNDSATDTDTVTTSADLSIVKTDSADPISPGDTLDYTIVVTNNGPSDAQSLQVTDSVPAPGSFVISGAVPSAGSCSISGNDVTCDLATLPVTGTWTITISVVLDPLTPGGLFTDTAIVTSTTADPAVANDQDSESTIVLPAADMVITKDDGVASIVAGTSTTYTITLRNDGPSTQLAGVVVSDTIPAGTTGSETEADCDINVGVFTCVTTATIAPLGSVTYLLTLDVPPDYASPTLANTATITSTPIVETDPTDDVATDTDAVTASADLAIIKTDLPDPVVAGNDVTYTLTVTNLGPSDATGVVVTDTLPGAVTFDTATPSQGSCSQASGVVTCPLGVLAAGATATIAIVVTTTIDGLITDTAVASASTTDPVPGNNTAIETTTVTAAADLEITKTDGVATVTAGTSTVYTITVTNSGPSVEPAGVVVSDTIPAGTNPTETETDCDIVASVFTCTTTSPLASGASVVYQLTIAIPAAYASATLSNTASISSFPILDPNNANNAATDIDTVSASADLGITKTDAPDPVVLGNDVTYTITVTNNGPSDAVGVVATDTLPGFSNFVSAGSSQGSCSEAAGIVTCPLGGLALDAVATIIVVVEPTVAVVITDQASVTATTPDLVPANNDAIEDTTVISSADLSIAKTDGIASVVAGTSTTYTITLTNNGPSVEPAGAVISDPIPAGTTGTESEADCSIVSGVFSCTLSASLGVGTSISYQLTLAIPAGYALTMLTNTVSITSSLLVDPDTANDSATDVDDVTASADLEITKTDGVTSVTPGSSTTYTIIVTNAGPSSAPAGVVVSDPIPPGTTGTETEGDCDIAAGVFTCTTSVSLAPGASVSYQLVIAIPVTYVGATLVNTATISTAPVPDLNPANGSASDTDTVTPIVADLSIVKTDSADPVAPGDPFSYTIVVSNAGPDPAQNVVVTDTVPFAFRVMGVASSEGSCANTGNAVTCTLSTLAMGSTWTIMIQVEVRAGAAPGSVINTATVTGIGDSTPANDASTQSTTIGETTGSADLVLTIVVDDPTPSEGDTITYTITVANKGPDDATGVVVTDVLPDGVTFVASRTARGGYQPGTGAWDIGSLSARLSVRLAPGQTVTLQIDATVDAGTAGTTIHNPASVTRMDQTDPTPDDDADTAPITVTAVLGTGGGTSFTGFPGTWPFVALFAFMLMGLASLAASRRRRA